MTIKMLTFSSIIKLCALTASLNYATANIVNMQQSQMASLNERMNQMINALYSSPVHSQRAITNNETPNYSVPSPHNPYEYFETEYSYQSPTPSTGSDSSVIYIPSRSGSPTPSSSPTLTVASSYTQSSSNSYPTDAVVPVNPETEYQQFRSQTPNYSKAPQYSAPSDNRYRKFANVPRQSSPYSDYETEPSYSPVSNNSPTQSMDTPYEQRNYHYSTNAYHDSQMGYGYNNIHEGGNHLPNPYYQDSESHASPSHQDTHSGQYPHPQYSSNSGISNGHYPHSHYSSSSHGHKPQYSSGHATPTYACYPRTYTTPSHDKCPGCHYTGSTNAASGYSSPVYSSYSSHSGQSPSSY